MKESSWYNKYRPGQLDDLVGQKNVVDTLKQASLFDRFSQTYIFTGNRGCGKTTTARIVANLLTCENVKDGRVCGKCRACQIVPSGMAMDVIELDGAKNRNVENVENLIEGAQWSPTELKKKVFIIDECLGKNSRINTENGLVTISSIVNRKKKVNVWSYNEKTKTLEPKPIVGWFVNSGKKINKLIFESEGIIYASDGHLILTPNGYMKVSDLKEGDYVYRIGESLTNSQKQLIYGSLLGDANIIKNQSRLNNPRNVNPRVRFVHGVKQKDYLEFKNNIMGNFSSGVPTQYFHNGFKDYPEIETWRINTKCSSNFSEIYSKVISNGKKTITKEWLKNVGWEGIAYWFCDDGSLQQYANKNNDGFMVTFHTQGFSLKENILIKKWLWSKKINCSILEEKRNGHILYRIALDRYGSINLLKNIYNFIPKCMKYKVKDFCKTVIDTDLNTEEGRIDLAKRMVDPILVPSDLKKLNGLVLEKIIKKELCGEENKTYDIEVKDNHNYFVSGTLVHNCHQLSDKAISALLKITEEPPSYLTFIFCTTDAHKIPETILSRSQRFNFRKITSKEMVSRLRYISDSEKIKITDEALYSIAKISRGCLRDAIVPLEQVATLMVGKDITEDAVQKYFSIPDRQAILQIVKSMVSGNINLLLDQVNDLIMSSADIESIAFEISDIFRSIMLIKAQGDTKLLDIPDHEIVEIKKLAEPVKLGQLDKLSRLFSSIKKEITYSINERWILESTLIHCAALLRKT